MDYWSMLPWLFAAILVAQSALYYLVCVHLSKKFIEAANDKDLVKEYAEFLRTDTHLWSVFRPRNMLPFLTMYSRGVIALCCLFTLTCFVVILTIGVDLENPKIGPIRRMLICGVVHFFCRAILFVLGLFWIKLDYVSTGEGDYSRWLGPDWKPSWDNPSTIVSNHISWMDILVGLIYFCPSFLSKNSVRQYPGVGRIAIAIDCVFFDRGGSKEIKENVA